MNRFLTHRLCECKLPQFRLEESQLLDQLDWLTSSHYDLLLGDSRYRTACELHAAHIARIRADLAMVRGICKETERAIADDSRAGPNSDCDL